MRAHEFCFLLASATLGLVGASGCSSSQSAPVEQKLPPGALGLVGSVALTPQLLDAVEGERAVAAEALSRDLLLAQEREARAPGDRRAIERGLLARRLVESLTEKAERTGPISADEWETARARLWLEVDRPRGVRTVDAFIQVAEFAPDQEAYALAEQVHAALSAPLVDPAGGLSMQEFAARASQVTAPSALKLVLTHRPAAAADGRVLPLLAMDQQLPPLEADVARAANQLTATGELSGIVGGKDGFHVLLCVEVVPEVRLAPSELQARLRPVVLASRASPELELLRQKLRANSEVSLTPQHSTLTRLVWRQQ